MTIGLFFILLAVLLAVAMPVGGVFGLMAILPNIMGTISFAPMDVVRAMFSGMNSFTLLAVPLFMVSGMIMAEGGLSERLFNFFGYFIGNKTAGFPCAVVVTCMFYAAISGSAPATVSAVGAMTIPFLTKMGYDIVFSTAIVTVAGGLGVIIPPSISYIVYAAAATASPSALFAAGIVPGCLIGFSLMFYCFIYCKKHGEDKEKLLASYNEIHAKGFGPLLKESFWALLTPVIILGCIYSGICSPTEAAVISVIYGLLVCIFAYKTIRIAEIGKVFIAGARTYVNILFVIAAASAFARAMTLLRYPQTISQAVLALTDNKLIILLLMNLIMLVCGMIIDNIPNIMILTPILLPIATSVGIDPVHFGIIMTANLAIGMITPPMGINLFVASGMTKIPMLKLSKATVPFLECFLVCLMLITFVPSISMFAVGGSSSKNNTTVNQGSDLDNIEASGEDYGEYEWTAAMTVADTTTNYKMVKYFSDMIEKKSGGSIKVEIYPGGQLGNTTEFTEAVTSGSIDIGTGMTTDLVDFVSEMGLFDMPNLFDSVEQMRALLQSDYVDTLNSYTESSGIHMLGFSDAGFRQLTTNKAVNSLGDLAGQKIRVMTNENHIAYWNAVGAAATPMQFNEVFMGLQQNTIDGEENPYMNIVGNNLQEVQKYIVETNHIGHIITFFMNNDLYQSLPDNTRALVDECAKAAVEYAAGVADEEIETDKQICIDAGCEIVTLDEADYAALKEKAQVVWDMVRKNLGDEKVDTLLKALENAGSSASTSKKAPELSSLTATGEDYGTYNWTAAMTVAETTTNYKMVEYFARAINTMSGGSITVDIYPGGQLGNTTEFTEAVTSGSIDIGTGMTTDLVDFVSEMALFDMPNLFTDVNQMRALLQSDYVETLNGYTETSGIHMLGFSDAGFRQLTTNKPVNSLADLAGQKIRVMTNEYHIAYWNALGAAATPMQFNEVFMGLQQNTIDGEENPYMNIVGNNLQEVQKYIVETNHIGHIITFFMNNDLYQSLPENTRALVDECAANAVLYGAEVADEEIETDKQICADAGCEIITLDEADYAALKEKAQVVWDMVRSNLGDEKVDSLLTALDTVSAPETESKESAPSLSSLSATGEDYGSYNWTAAMTVAETTTNYKMVEYFAQAVNIMSGGSINIDIYPGGQLGNTTEFTEAVTSGSIDIGTGMTTDLVDFVSEMALFDMPNLFDDVDQMRALLQSDYVDTLNDYTEASGIHMLGFSDAGFRQLTTNKPVNSLADLAGQKIRVMTNEYHIAYWNALGAAATPMQFNEVFMGLQQNTIDGEENPYMNIVGNNLQEVQKYIVETNHIGHIITFFMNNDLYQSLPDNTRALIDECASYAVLYGAEVADEEIETDKKLCADAGCEIITLNESDYVSLKEKASVVWDMVREKLGDEKVDTLLDALKKAQ